MDAPDEADAVWQRQYSFTTDPVHPADMELGNHWTSMRPGTLFTSTLIVSRITDNGFTVLMGNSIRSRDPSNAHEGVIESATALRDALSTRFGISLDETEARRLFQFAGG